MSCSLSNSNQLPFFSKRASTTLPFPNFTTSSLQLHSDKPCRRRLRALLSIQEIPPNALRRKNDPLWRGGFSLGVDLGLSRSGIALSKGLCRSPSHGFGIARTKA
ncbi:POLYNUCLEOTIDYL TRANSFERASE RIBONUCLEASE H-LIKE SUPERFAMILY PROTEIN [Salix purpurea]|uniref:POLYNUCLEOTIDYL TRANSFERASE RIBONUCLEASE H-LIKE SUPERFAMILY PROTEIN n=1 Tax=Salix purpurea TaxID=77065 RepID=A0A9Q0TGP8_SALPP|nr:POLYNUCLEOTIDYL TRANSFERASE RIBONUCLEASE H-LIKE SUPERFAMILY PROTEIN [Salix purpurea]